MVNKQTPGHGCVDSLSKLLECVRKMIGSRLLYCSVTLLGLELLQVLNIDLLKVLERVFVHRVQISQPQYAEEQRCCLLRNVRVDGTLLFGLLLVELDGVQALVDLLGLDLRLAQRVDQR